MIKCGLKSLIKSVFFISILFGTANSIADGGISILTDVLEEVRIKVIPLTESQTTTDPKSKKGSSSRVTTTLGSISSEYVDCTNCKKVINQYGLSTKLINPFGKNLSIEELKTWSGSRAEIHYRATDNYIELIKILP